MTTNEIDQPIAAAGREGKDKSEHRILGHWIDQDPVLAAKNAADATRRQNLAAGLALAGFELHDADDGFVIRRWGREHFAPDLDSVAEFARRVGAPL